MEKHHFSWVNQLFLWPCFNLFLVCLPEGMFGLLEMVERIDHASSFIDSSQIFFWGVVQLLTRNGGLKT